MNFTEINTTVPAGDFWAVFKNGYGTIHQQIALTVCSVGIVFNMFNICVLNRRSMRSPTNTILLALAISDMLKMISYVPFVIHFYSPNPDCVTYEWTVFLAFHMNFSLVTHTSSMFLGVLLAAFRYVYTCKVHLMKRLCTMSRTAKYIGLIYVFVMVLDVPPMVLYRIKINGSVYISCLENNNTFNETCYCYEYRPMEGLFQKVTLLSQGILVKLLPCVLLLGFVSRIVISITKHSNKAKKISTSNSKKRSKIQAAHNRSSKMLLTVLILFLVTELPHAILFILLSISTPFKRVYNSLGDLLDTIALVNNAINFAIYCGMSSQFRVAFANMWCRCFYRTIYEERVQQSEMKEFSRRESVHKYYTSASASWSSSLLRGDQRVAPQLGKQLHFDETVLICGASASRERIPLQE